MRAVQANSRVAPVEPGRTGVGGSPNVGVEREDSPLPVEQIERLEGAEGVRVGLDPAILRALNLHTVESRVHDALMDARRRAEHKSLGHDGQPASEETIGQLRRRPIRSTPEATELTGKEGNKLDERTTGQITDPTEYRNDYGQRSDPWLLVLAILQEIGAPRLIQLTGFARSSVYAVLRGARPRAAHSAAYLSAAVEYARAQLVKTGRPVPTTDHAILDRYLKELGGQGELLGRCEQCGSVIPAGRRADARFCSARCRKAAGRARRQTALDTD